jgi:hypothetical protein
VPVKTSIDLIFTIIKRIQKSCETVAFMDPLSLTKGLLIPGRDSQPVKEVQSSGQSA